MMIANSRFRRVNIISFGRAAGVSLGLLILLSILFPGHALADIAPPDQPPGVNLLPGDESTQVRMLAESVLIDVLANTPAGSLGQARVTAHFTMQNLGSTDEKMLVRFPLTFWNGANDGFGRFPEIKNFAARVNGRAAPVRRVEVKGPGSSDTSLPWAEFEVNFPAGKELPVEVSYLTEGVGEYPFISFKYILETGAGWRDSIGEADLTLRLPYEANNQNVIFDEQIGWSQTTPGSSLMGREVQWKFNNFEPSSADNLEVSLLMPSTWKKVLQERNNITRNPDDGEAWGRLGKLYKEIISYRRGLRQDSGGQELYRLSVAAYEKALALLPKDALWHAGFADLLYRNYYWSQFFTESPDHTDMLRALDELRLSMELNPNNPKALEILDDMKYALPEAVRQEGDHYVLLWLTATPTSRPTYTETSSGGSDLSSLTPTLVQTPTPEMTPTSPTSTATFPPTDLPGLIFTPSATQPVLDTATPAAESDQLTVCGANIGMIAALFFVGWLWKGQQGMKQ